MRREWLIYIGLFLTTSAVFWPVSRCQFVNFDDPQYVTENPHIKQGLTPASVGWAFTSTIEGNWHPATCLSHMLDCQLFGLDAGAHHLVNLLFHAANTLLLFHVLRRMTHELWPSAAVAALFALHPLHVESVAWVSERKDVLSTFFGLLTIAAYARYAQEGSAKRKVQWYLLVMVLFALGLMSKPMLVTWPFVLLLLDYWPLQRFTIHGLRITVRHLVWEKLPLLALTIMASAVTFLAQHHAKAVIPDMYFTISERIENTLVSYVRYLCKTVWPSHLAVFYPFPSYPHPTWPVWQVIGSAALLALITLAVVWQARHRPFLIVGWLWFLGTLVPVIGLVQIGNQAMADRYSYIPLIGLFVMAVWGVKEFASWGHQARFGLGVAATAALAACITVSSLQLRHWRNSEALWQHTLDVTTDNLLTHANLSFALLDEGKIEEAMTYLNKEFRIKPDFVEGRYRLAEALARQGRIRESIAQYREVLRYQPDLPDALNNLAWVLATSKDAGIRDGAEAVQLAQHACELTHHQQTMMVGTLAAAYAEAGRFDDAITTAQKACALASESGEQDLLKKNQELLVLYRAHQPYHETQ
jgi:cytochrome c-type biogenesis protein CcmH/NrfG